MIVSDIEAIPGYSVNLQYDVPSNPFASSPTVPSSSISVHKAPQTNSVANRWEFSFFTTMAVIIALF